MTKPATPDTPGWTSWKDELEEAVTKHITDEFEPFLTQGTLMATLEDARAAGVTKVQVEGRYYQWYEDDVWLDVTPGEEANMLKAPGLLDPKPSEGLRFDEGKTRLDLLPPEWPWALAEVLTAGIPAHGERNWEKGMAWHKVAGPILRHFFKWLAGAKMDPETGCHHLAHVAWNALALMSYEIRGLGTDDLARPGEFVLGLVREKRE